MTLLEKYQEKLNTPSDINELLPYLHEYANKCAGGTIVELGVRTCVASYSFISSNAKVVYGYDIERQPEVYECQHLSKESGKDWRFVEADVLKVEIPECDFLFIDTFHSAEQLKRELNLHSGKAKRYIGFHDTTTFWETAETSYQSANNNQVDVNEGLKYAIEPFLQNNPQWKQILRLENNNGLTILERIS